MNSGLRGCHIELPVSMTEDFAQCMSADAIPLGLKFMFSLDQVQSVFVARFSDDEFCTGIICEPVLKAGILGLCTSA